MNPADKVDDLLAKAGAQWRAGQPSPPSPTSIGSPRASARGDGSLCWQPQCRRDRDGRPGRLPNHKERHRWLP